MKSPKNISVSFRVSERFKLLLTAAAVHERRSRTNLLEILLFSFCQERHIKVPSRPVRKKIQKGEDSQ
jgi:hypothetical protein